MEGSVGIYEIRVESFGNIFRIMCFFESGNRIVLLNCFQKKSNRIPKREIEISEKLKNEYLKDKSKTK